MFNDVNIITQMIDNTGFLYVKLASCLYLYPIITCVVLTLSCS